MSACLPELPDLLEGFLRQWLPEAKGASPHTRASYATCFTLLVSFAARRCGCRADQLRLEQLDGRLVLDFLAQLQSERKNGARSRNARLAAIKSFARYVETKRPDALAQLAQLRAIPTKRFDQPLIDHLEPDEQRALLEEVPADTALGLRDRAMLLICLDLGLRESELLNLRLRDLQMSSPAQLHIHGKGRREAEMPLSQRAHQALARWLEVRGKVATDRVFLNYRCQPLAPRGFQLIVRKYAAKAAERLSSLKRKNITPHSLRHTCAMVTLKACGNDIRKVALWLRHASPQTSEIYVRADPAVRLELPAANAAGIPLRRGKFKPSDRVMDLLRKARQPHGLCALEPVAVEPAPESTAHNRDCA